MISVEKRKQNIISFLFSTVFAILYSSQFCSFICQVGLARRKQSDLCGLRVKLPPVTTSLTTQR